MAKTKKEKSTEGKSELRETISTVIWALAIAFVLRTFVFQPFTIPSGSMEPGLMEGDYIITSKYSLGYGAEAAKPLPFLPVKDRILKRGPERGDVIVFRPEGISKNFVKRIIGLPGDQVQVLGGRVYINGEPVAFKRGEAADFVDAFGNTANADVFIETLDSGASYPVYDSQINGPYDKTTLRTVPQGYYFLMGDNRDNSFDSRVAVRNGGAGLVPSGRLIGKAEFILLSVEEAFVLYKPWTWGNMRGARFFKRIE